MLGFCYDVHLSDSVTKEDFQKTMSNLTQESTVKGFDLALSSRVMGPNQWFKNSVSLTITSQF
ncbi:unnamed protein product [Eruca vesicaria subsp. sativa]|uniref:Uncharacterized protein n=1 Tax=Eruca vesicaria subsp. sativa TaxID=29727 RepID=A0ABC8LV05_ERUVS|nr:unnamed protein product [Eruca vesicaria subsp. sativa]